MILLVITNININETIYVQAETIIILSEYESVSTIESTSDSIGEIPADINHVQVSAQYVDHKKSDNKDDISNITLPKILILVFGFLLIVFCIVWIKKTYL